VRASDRTRHRTTSALARAAGEGFLSIDTLSLRLDAALTARDVDRLDALVSDLPWYRQPPGAVLRAVWHRLTEPDEPPARLALPAQQRKFVIGRGADCDVLVHDRAISRHHARIRRTVEGWDVLDLGSTNGTWLNGRRIRSAIAQPGDELELADRRFLLP
jgi:FHA domain-containing protein/uncharacterized protein DUF1707